MNAYKRKIFELAALDVFIVPRVSNIQEWLFSAWLTSCGHTLGRNFSVKQMVHPVIHTDNGYFFKHSLNNCINIAVIHFVVYWVMTLCRLVLEFQTFERLYCLCLQGRYLWRFELRFQCIRLRFIASNLVVIFITNRERSVIMALWPKRGNLFFSNLLGKSE